MAELIWVDDAEILAALNRLLVAVDNPRPALLDAAEQLMQSTQQRFSTKTAPDGSQWDRNSDVTIARKGENNPLIGGDIGVDGFRVGGGTLLQQFNYDLSDDGFDLFNTMQYAAMQQFGGAKEEFPHLWGDIPARPFLGVSEDDKEHVLAIFTQFFERSLF